jgi:hypothetical protein
VCVGTGLFFNSPISDWKNTLGANVEYGRYLKSGISVGINFGYWSLMKGYEFNGAKITFPIYDNDYYCFSFSGGINYFYGFKDILLEYDKISNKIYNEYIVEKAKSDILKESKNSISEKKLIEILNNFKKNIMLFD